VRPGATRMNDALRNALVVEMGDLLAEGEILQKAGAPRAASQGVLIVRDRNALVGRQGLVEVGGCLVGFAAIAGFGRGILGSHRLRGFFSHW
jgi:hypothetical protein